MIFFFAASVMQNKILSRFILYLLLMKFVFAMHDFLVRFKYDLRRPSIYTEYSQLNSYHVLKMYVGLPGKNGDKMK